LSLFSVGILSVLPLFTQSIKFSRTNNDKMIASMLAQEGIELARNVRDNEWLEADDNDTTTLNDHNFVYSFADNFTSGTKYFACKQNDGLCSAISQNAQADALNDNSAIIYIDTTNKKYTSVATGNTDSGFDRIIEIIANTDAITNNTVYTVNSIVRWTTNNTANSYTASTELYDWR